MSLGVRIWMFGFVSQNLDVLVCASGFESMS